MSRMRPALLLAWVLLPAAAAPGEEPSGASFPAESRPAALRLEQARALLAEGKTTQAVQELQTLAEATDDSLVPAAGRLASARRLAQAELSRLPPAALQAYRDRVEGQARQRLATALATRDERLLRRLAEEDFCSRAGAQAVDALGDLAFERGRFLEAECWWRLLAEPLDKGRSAGELAYPDPVRGAARARAKQLLARLFAGPDSGWQDALQTYRREHGDAAGALAGRKGRYADILAELSRERRPAHAGSGLSWTTFGGDGERGLVVPAGPDVLDRLGELCRTPWRRYGLQERTPLSDGETPLARPRIPGEMPARALAFHPLLTPTHALTADARYVTGYDLRSGQVETWYDAARDNGGVAPDLKLPAPADLRYTLTLGDGCVYARLGAQTIRRPPVEPGRNDRAETFLVCLSLKPGPKGERLRWQVRPGIGKDNTVFEGAPLLRDNLVYVAVTRFSGERTTTAIHCYADHLSATPPFAPPLRWKVDVVETHELPPGETRLRHHLLTLAGPNVVYCSHSGAIVAVDAVTGAPAWAVRYPRRTPPEEGEPPPLRDLAPGMVGEGRLYVAPADGEHIFCLDPATGKELWRREQPDVVHLLGVGTGRLIFATATGLKAVRASDGAEAGGWTLPDVGGRLPPMGRGLLLGDLVLWPTKRGVLAVRQEDGLQPDNPTLLHGLPAGNLVVAEGCVAVADRTTLTVFTPPAWRLEERKKAAARQPESSAAALEYGCALADAGDFREARELFARAERLADGNGTQGQELRTAARQERQRTLLAEGRTALRQGRADEAGPCFRAACGEDFLPAERVDAVRRAARLLEKADRPADAVDLWAGVLADPVLRATPLSGEKSLPERAAAVAGRQVERLVKEDAGTANRIETEARRRLAAAGPDEREAVLDRLAEEVPNAAATRTTLRVGPAARGGPALRAGGMVLAAAAGLRRCRRPSRGPGRTAARDRADATRRDGQSGAAAAALLVRRPGRRRNDSAVRRAGCGLPPDGVSQGRRSSADVPGNGGWDGALAALAVLPAGLGRPFRRPGRPRRRHRCCLSAFGRWPPAVGPGRRRLARRGDATAPVGVPFGGRTVVPPCRSAPAGPRRQYRRDALAALGAGGRLGDGAFLPAYAASGAAVTLRTDDRRCWLLSAADGRLLRELSGGAECGGRTPVDLGGDVGLALDSQRVVRLGADGSVRWTFAPHGPGLMAEEPRLLSAGDALAVAWATNLGWRVQRLDPISGQPLWPRSVLLEAADDPAGWSISADMVFVVVQGRLRALALADGRPRWQTPLPVVAGTWAVRCRGGYVIVWPDGVERTRLQFRWLTHSVQWSDERPLVEAQTRARPVLWCDVRTGRLVQRLNLEAAPPRQRWTVSADPAWPLLPSWRRTDEQSAAATLLLPTAHGLAAPLGGRLQAWSALEP